mmetsp:Transcript_28849/g.85185  ORF Transcript_28849/g.85185 Transcript_28849/m.85185 type:complete len:105 (-) Transcript_28849:1620-1934(-)
MYNNNNDTHAHSQNVISLFLPLFLTTYEDLPIPRAEEEVEVAVKATGIRSATFFSAAILASLALAVSWIGRILFLPNPIIRGRNANPSSSLSASASASVIMTSL